MPFDLYITTPMRREFRTLNSPYAKRGDMAESVRLALTVSLTRQGDDWEKFFDLVLTADLGATVTHASGVSFRTELSKSPE